MNNVLLLLPRLFTRSIIVLNLPISILTRQIITETAHLDKKAGHYVQKYRTIVQTVQGSSIFKPVLVMFSKILKILEHVRKAREMQAK